MSPWPFLLSSCTLCLLCKVPFVTGALLQLCSAWCSLLLWSLSLALCRTVLSCVLWEVAEDDALSLTVLFIFQSQKKDLNRKIGVIELGRHSVSESLLKQGFPATLAIREVETLGCPFLRDGIVDCPHHERTVTGLLKGKISYVCPRAPVSLRKVPH